jgi:uncharacterized protein YndB with AHSA1/START domain
MAPESQEITITRTIRTTPARVYAAFASVDGWCAWCCEKAEADARIGGRLRIYTEGYNAYGEFAELEPDRRVAFTWDGDAEPPVLIRVLLDGHRDRTVVTFQVTGRSSAKDWAGIASFLERTWGRVLDNLKAVLEAGPRTATGGEREPQGMAMAGLTSTRRSTQ